MDMYFQDILKEPSNALDKLMSFPKKRSNDRVVLRNFLDKDPTIRIKGHLSSVEVKMLKLLDFSWRTSLGSDWIIYSIMKRTSLNNC